MPRRRNWLNWPARIWPSLLFEKTRRAIAMLLTEGQTGDHQVPTSCCQPCRMPVICLVAKTLPPSSAR